MQSFFVVITFAIIVVIGILVAYTDSGIYGEVILSESAEWEKKAILDITTSDTNCPSGYEIQVSDYFGTETIC